MSSSAARIRPKSDVPRLVLLTGATGHLGSYVRRELIRLGWPAIGWTKSPILTDVGLRLERVDLTQRKLVVEACRALSPSHIIHAAALANALTCAREPEQAFKINAQSTQLLAELAKAAKARLLLVSTDLVFNGEQGNYQERALKKMRFNREANFHVVARVGQQTIFYWNRVKDVKTFRC